MADREPVTAQDIAQRVGGVLRGDPKARARWVCTLNRPRAECLAFAKDLERLKGSDPTQAGVILLVPTDADGQLSGTYICVERPRQSFAVAVSSFFVSPPKRGIAQSARIHSTAKIGRNVVIGEGCVLGAGVMIGDDTEIRNNVVIGDRVTIGSGCLIKSSSVIGEEGFGIEKDPQGRNIRIPHLGSVIIGDNVEIGALNAVVSGTIDPTIVEDNVKTDDHVHIAHNCHIGANVIITACAELSGSVVIGRDTWLGPNCSIINGIEIAPGTFVGLGTVVTKSLTTPGTYAGSPARLLPSRPRDAQ